MCLAGGLLLLGVSFGGLGFGGVYTKLGIIPKCGLFRTVLGRCGGLLPVASRSDRLGLLEEALEGPSPSLVPQVETVPGSGRRKVFWGFSSVLLTLALWIAGLGLCR